jgi:hypothetical protein
MSCGVQHPDKDAHCDRQRGNHPRHSAYFDGAFIDWPNPNYVASAPRKASREQQDARTRKKMRDMAERTKEAKPKPTFYPTENDRLGRTALYLRKYRKKWISLEELELSTVAGSAANTSISTLINRYGWDIKVKIQAKDERKFFMLVSE